MTSHEDILDAMVEGLERANGWELIERKSTGRHSKYGKQWDQVPAIGITKAGFSLNRKFCDAFCGKSTAVLVLIKRSARKIGLKMVLNGEFDPAAFSIRLNSPKKSQGGARIVSCKAAGVAFPDAVGHGYRAHSSADGRVIEIEISPENMLR